MIRQIIAITLKDLKVLSRDTGGIATLLLMPMMFIVVMSLALGGLFSGSDSPIKVLLVNEDNGQSATRLTHDFKGTEGIRVETDWEGTRLTRAKAESLIVKHERSLAVVIPSGFSHGLERTASEATPPDEARQLELMVDPALSAQFVGPIQGVLAGLSEKAAMFAMMPQGIDWFIEQVDKTSGSVLAQNQRQSLRATALGALEGGKLGSVPRVRRTQPSGMTIKRPPNVVQQNVPGWTLFGVFFISAMLATSILEEKRIGTFRRIMAAPMSRAVFLLGKLLPSLIVNLIQIVLMFAVGVLVMPVFGTLRLELGPHLGALAVISLAVSLAATGLGLLIAALSRTAEQVSGLSSLVVVTMAAVGGVMVPRFVMPQFLQIAGLVTPHAWALDAYQDVLVRGYGLLHILPEVAALLGFAVFFFGIALWRFKWD